MDIMEKIKGGLIVSCQALPHEPLHSSFIMGRMALAVKEGGAIGIKANTKNDIIAIKNEVELPVIGMVRRDYEDSKVSITPTMKEVEELVDAGADIINLDATSRPRPHGKILPNFIGNIRKKYPKIVLMGDVSNISEAREAVELGIDIVTPTLVGETTYTKGVGVEEDNYKLVRDMLAEGMNVIVEGKIDTPEKAREVLDLGVICVVTGSAITRPRLITRKFVEGIENQ